MKTGSVSAKISVEGMTCSSCAGVIDSALNKVAGVRSVNVSLTQNMAVVEFDSTVTTADTLVDEVESVGFGAAVLSQKKMAAPVTSSSILTKISVEGMTCSSCAGVIDSALSKVVGVKTVNVSLTQNMAVVEFDSTVTTAESLAEEIESVGFGAAVLSQKKADSSGDEAGEGDPKVLLLVLEGRERHPPPALVSSLAADLRALNGVVSLEIQMESKNRAKQAKGKAKSANGVQSGDSDSALVPLELESSLDSGDIEVGNIDEEVEEEQPVPVIAFSSVLAYCQSALAVLTGREDEPESTSVQVRLSLEGL